METVSLLIRIIGFIVFVEGFTELLINNQSIVYKWLHQRRFRKHIPAFTRLAMKCGWCFSLQVTIVMAIAWFFTPLIYPMSLICFWRLANLYHTANSILLRKKIFTGGKSL